MTDHPPDNDDRLADLERRVTALETALARPRNPVVAAPPPPPPPPPPRTPVDRAPVEATRFLAWAGSGLVVLGAAFLVSLAVARGWLTPEVRVVGAGILGGGLVVAGLRIAPDHTLLGRLLAVTGLITLYLDGWAAYQVFSFYGEITAPVVMVIVSATALALAIWMREAATAALATVGGLAAPVLVSAAANTDPSPGGLAAYASALYAVVMVVYLWVGWRSLYLTASVGVLGLLAAAVGEVASSEAATARNILVSLVVALIVGAAPVVRAGLRGRPPVKDPEESLLERFFEPVLKGLTPAVVGAGPAVFAVLTIVLFDMGDRSAGLLAAVMAVMAAAAAWVLFGDVDRRSHLGWYAQAYAIAAGALVVSAAGWLVTDDTALAVAGVMLPIAMITGRRLPAPALTWAAHLAAAILAVIYLVRIPVTAAGIGELTVGRVVADLVVVAAFAVTAWLENPEVRAVRSVYGVLAWVGLLGILAEVLARLDNGQALVSGAWAVSGLVLLVVARTMESRPLSVLALTTLGLVVAKLVLSDLSGIDPVWRIFLFLAIGLLFLWTAARFRRHRAIPPAVESSPPPG